MRIELKPGTWLHDARIRMLARLQRATYHDCVELEATGQLPATQESLIQMLSAMSGLTRSGKVVDSIAQEVADLVQAGLLKNADGPLHTLHVQPYKERTYAETAAIAQPKRRAPADLIRSDQIKDPCVVDFGGTGLEVRERLLDMMQSAFGDFPCTQEFRYAVESLVRAGRGAEVMAAIQRVEAAMQGPVEKRPKNVMRYLAYSIIALTEKPLL